MKREEAIKILRNVCGQFRGTLQEHNAIQLALNTLIEPKIEQGQDKPLKPSD